MALFIRLTVLVALGIVLLVVAAFILKALVLGAIVAGLVVAGILAYNFIRRLANGGSAPLVRR